MNHLWIQLLGTEKNRCLASFLSHHLSVKVRAEVNDKTKSARNQTETFSEQNQMTDITLVIIRGATEFVWKFSIIFSAVTV